jgi:hypothetical protein
MKTLNRSAASFSNINLPSTNRCLEKSQELKATESSVRTVEVVPAKLVDIVLNKSASELSHREIRALPYFILDSRFRDFNPVFAKTVLRDFSNGRTFWPTLFNAWLFHYDLRSGVGKAVREALRTNRSQLPDMFLTLNSTFNILETKPNLHKVALLILKGDIGSELLQEISFSGDGVSGGQFSLALLSGFAKCCMTEALTESELMRLVQILCPHGALHDSIRDVALVSFIYSIEKRSRESEVFLSVKEIIDNNFKDPRIYAHQWPAISEYLGGEKTRNHCINIVKQWHIFQSITLFFKLIEEVVEDQEHEHHFPQRRKFWIDYFDKGMVSDAWVILGSKGANEADRYKRSGDADFASLAWAKLSTGKSDQCVLLMQIGETRVVEWSHSGACRLWASGDRNAPMMSRPRYTGSDLRAVVADDVKDRVVHDPGGRWKTKIEQRIRAYSGWRRFV